MKKPGIILIGGGGHCKSCIDVIEQDGNFHIAGIIDLKERIGEKILGYPIIGSDDDLKALSNKYDYYFITLGQIKSSDHRKELFEKIKHLGKTLPTIISPKAYVSIYAEIGEGSIVMHNATINASSKIGSNCIINSMALIEHDSVINNNCHISTRATINGNCIINEGNFIGSGTVINQGVFIEENCVIGSGSTVLKDIKIEKSIWAGNPARMK